MDSSLPIDYHVYIWQMSAQLTPLKYECDKKKSDRYFRKIEKFVYG